MSLYPNSLNDSSLTLCTQAYTRLDDDGSDGELVEALEAATIEQNPEVQEKQEEAEENEEQEGEKFLPIAFPLPWGGFAFFNRHLSLKDDASAWTTEFEKHRDHIKGFTSPSFAIIELNNVYLRLSNDGADGSFNILAVVSYYDDAVRLRDTFEIPIYQPIPTSVCDEALLRASMTIEGESDTTWRHLVALENMLHGRWDTIAKLLKRPLTLDRHQKEGKTLAMSVLATKLRGFFCAGVFHIVHATVKPHSTPNWGALTLKFK